MSYRTQDQLLLAGVQGAKGTEEALVLADAVKAGLSTFGTNLETLQTNYAKGTLDEGEPEIGGGGATLSVPCYLKGSGTAGVAPDYGKLLRGCGMSETITGAAVTGTATAGGANAITLDVGASASDNAYVGMVVTITGGTGAGQTRVIEAYDGTTKIATVTPAWTVTPDATAAYEIPVNVLYRPVSTGLEWLTFWRFMNNSDGATDSRRKRLFDGQGTFQLTVPTRGLVESKFEFKGRLAAAPDDVAHPGAASFQASTPKMFASADAYLGDNAVKFSECTFDMAGQVDQPDNPADAYGYDGAEVLRRAPTGRITPQMSLLSQRNAFADWLDGTTRHLWLNWGAAAGQRVSLLMPDIKFTGNEEADVRGFASEALPFAAARQDNALFICLW